MKESKRGHKKLFRKDGNIERHLVANHDQNSTAVKKLLAANQAQYHECSQSFRTVLDIKTLERFFFSETEIDESMELTDFSVGWVIFDLLQV